MKRIQRFDLLTTDLGHALVVYDLAQIPAEVSGCRWGQLVSLISFRRYLGQVIDNQCVTKICSQQIETSYSFNSNRSKVSENTTITLILGAMNNIFHNVKIESKLTYFGEGF